MLLGSPAFFAKSVTVDVTSPTITSASAANNYEGLVLAHALTANESVTWSIIGGVDQADFEISGSTLRWASNGVQDYGTPQDSDTNNVYVVNVRATDIATNTADQTISVTVLEADPHFANVVLLAGFEGSDGATSYVEEKSGLTATFLGNAQLDTAEKELGVSSALFDQFGDRISFANSASWDFGSGSFTVEISIRPSSVAVTKFIMGVWGAANLGWSLFQVNQTLLTGVSTTGANNLQDCVSGNILTANTWSKVCWDFNGSTYRLYHNGTMVDSFATPRTIFDSPHILGIGMNSDNSFAAFDFGGHIDEIRITKGVARYASDSGYTPAAFPRA